jgi:hypothetical protein
VLTRQVFSSALLYCFRLEQVGRQLSPPWHAAWCSFLIPLDLNIESREIRWKPLPQKNGIMSPGIYSFSN